MPYNNVNEAVGKLFKSLFSKYQNGLEKSMRVIDFIFDSVQILYCKYHKINLRRGGSYIDWTKKETKDSASNNKFEKHWWLMFSICINRCIKLWRN